MNETVPERSPKKSGRNVPVIIMTAALVAAPTSGKGGEAAQAAPVGMRFMQRNARRFDEYLWLKDSSVVIRIPAGTFTMGSPRGEGDADERPQHRVSLSEYYVDKYEVTNRQYKRFCDATGRTYPSDPDFTGMPGYFTAYPSYPVVNVSWADAQAYCTWAGKQLPTEAEWEKAARGTDARKYPWGSAEPSGKRSNYADRNTDSSWRDANADDGYARTAPVGTYPAGVSPYGLMDMAGNVWEWCNDWHSESYYGSSANNNPQGPSSGPYRVTRGGSWLCSPMYLRAANRDRCGPSDRYHNLGFRCSLRQ
ncbi:formylglycine-generating enzyme family protein [candidate division WOR-3 bacterium]|nr:formylglycine-generating enzyme family protein [candidate division WOR-3 bacterium]